MNEPAQLHDVELEEAVLGAVLLEEEVFQKLSSDWDEAVFHKMAHKTIAWAVTALFHKNEPIDRITVGNHLKANNKLEEVGGYYGLQTIGDRVGGTGNAHYHYRILQQLHMLRKLSTIGMELKIATNQNMADPFELISFFEQKITSLTSNITKFSINTIDKVNNEAIDRLEKIRSGVIDPGVFIPFKSLQSHTGGWQKTELIILAARPGMGKTSLALQFLLQPAIEKKIPTALFSLEMGRLQIMSRIQSILTGHSATNLIRGNITKNDLESLKLSTQFFSTLPVFIDDTPALSVLEFRQRARKLKKENGVQLIIIDYIQLMRAGIKGGNREQEISAISRALKETAKELEIPIIALSQLSRDVEKRGASKIPMLSDLRESGAIEQDADMVCFIYRPEYYGLDVFEDDTPAKGRAEIIVAKNRNGACVSTIIGFEAHNVKFHDFEEINELPKLQPNTNF